MKDNEAVGPRSMAGRVVQLRLPQAYSHVLRNELGSPRGVSAAPRVLL